MTTGDTMYRLTMMAVLAVAGLVGCDRDKPAAGPVAAKPAAVVTELEGVWDQVDGHRAWQWEFRGDTLIERTGPKRIETGRSAVKLSRAVEPPTIDGENIGRGGIYRVEGDTLVVCYSGKVRPTQFTDGGGEFLMYTFKRSAK